MNRLLSALTATIITFGLVAIPKISDANVVFDATNAPQPFSQLPTCGSNLVGARATITDGPANAAWNTSVSAGGGTTTIGLYCDGKAWKVYAGGSGGNVVPPVPVPLAAMSPPSGTSPTSGNATMGNYANSCNANGTSCLLAEDRFTGSQLNSNYWYPWLGTGSSHRWVGCGNPSQCAIPPQPYSTEATCTDSSPSACTAMGVIDYFNPFPFGYSYNSACAIQASTDNGDGAHLQNSANGLIITESPGHSTTVLPSTTDCIWGGTDASLNAYNAGLVWTSAAISSTNHPAFICPSTGCYVQARVILPDTRYGAWPVIWLMPENTTGSNGNQGEIDINEGGFYWQGNSANTTPVNQIVSSTFHGGFTGITGFNGSTCGNNECQFNSGTDLTEAAGSSNWHIFGLEYLPNQKITVYLDGKAFGQWTGGIGSASYDVIFDIDMCYTGSLSWRTCQTTGQNGPFHFYVNDVQVYKLPGQ